MKSQTDARLHTNGFTLLETLVVLLIISILSILGSPLLYRIDCEHFRMSAQYAFSQQEAIASTKRQTFEHHLLYGQYPIHFNGKGQINISQTLSFRGRKERKVIIYLGAGRIIIE